MDQSFEGADFLFLIRFLRFFLSFDILEDAEAAPGLLSERAISYS